MLVLSRRKDETIMIGDEIEITIVDIKGDTVRVGINAPRSVAVHRKEIYEAIQEENIAASQQQSVPDKGAIGGLAAMLKGMPGGGESAGGPAAPPSSAPPPAPGDEATPKKKKKKA